MKHRIVCCALAAGLLFAPAVLGQRKDMRAIGPGVDRPGATDPPPSPWNGFLGRIVP
jgi:hypothetical protein